MKVIVMVRVWGVSYIHVSYSQITKVCICVQSFIAQCFSTLRLQPQMQSFGIQMGSPELSGNLFC